MLDNYNLLLMSGKDVFGDTKSGLVNKTDALVLMFLRLYVCAVEDL